MVRKFDPSQFNGSVFRKEAADSMALIRSCRDVRAARTVLFHRLSQYQFDASIDSSRRSLEDLIIVRDCARSLRGVLKKSSDSRTGFSVMAALWDIAHDVPRPDLQPGFYAEMIHLFRGVSGRAIYPSPADLQIALKMSGRKAALARSRELDRIWHQASDVMARYPDGLEDASRERRAARQEHILRVIGGTRKDWSNWKWHVRHIVKNPDLLERLVTLGDSEIANIRGAREARLPFGVTPYYLSLMDDDPQAGRDRAIRAQVFPPANYVREMAVHHGERSYAFDFMLEHDTSPVDLVTRRYPAIVILKPFNTCPQICVYCQRNWEIDDAMAPHALAPAEKIEEACRWIERHPAICEVLVTGGDPLAMSDGLVERILHRLARIRSLDLIRIGTRIPATMPMRITDDLAALLGSVRDPGRREVCMVTHVEHPYEITPEFVDAINRLRLNGIAVYNQMVYTFYVSRRFESARLRLLLRRAGVDPYYTFIPKGKQETRSYRIPLARILQEQKEEARLLPGLRRTDEAVYNVPGMGKNHLRDFQHRDLVTIRPDGARVYEYHPWEKKKGRDASYLGEDIPILEYLLRLADIGEDPRDYRSIWYYF